MKKIIPILTVALLALSTACGGGSKGNDSTTSANDSIANDTAVDSLALALSRLDSIQSKGKLVHFDTWKIGNLKSIEVQAQKFSSDNDSIVFITLRKDCGGEYYYSWEGMPSFSKRNFPRYMRRPTPSKATSTERQTITRSMPTPQRIMS